MHGCIARATARKANWPISAMPGHALMENRNGLVVGAGATLANGTAEREAATSLTQDLPDVAASLGYTTSMRCRKRIGEVFGWGKGIGGLAQLKVRGPGKVKAVFTFAMAAYNIVRLPKLLRTTGEPCLDAGK